MNAQTYTLTPQQIWDIKMSNVCRCGRRKEPRLAHCYGCYRKLPEEHRQGLRRRFTEGFVPSYLASVQYLDRRRANYDLTPMPDDDRVERLASIFD